MGTAKGEGGFSYDDSATFAKKFICYHFKYVLKAATRLSSLELSFLLVFKNDFPLPLQSLAKHSRNNIGAEGGPPPFVPFGQVRVMSMK